MIPLDRLSLAAYYRAHGLPNAKVEGTLIVGVGRSTEAQRAKLRTEWEQAYPTVASRLTHVRSLVPQ